MDLHDIIVTQYTDEDGHVSRTYEPPAEFAQDLKRMTDDELVVYMLGCLCNAHEGKSAVYGRLLRYGVIHCAHEIVSRERYAAQIPDYSKANPDGLEDYLEQLREEGNI